MKHRLYLYLTVFILMFFYFNVVACSHLAATTADAADSSSADQADVETIEARIPQQQGILVREARAEADSLRSELAAVKIASAKQQAELQSARDGLMVLREREEEVSAHLQQAQADLANAEQDRHQLRRENAELQAQSASTPALEQLAAELQTIQSSVHEMVADMKTLMTEVSYIKQDMRHNRRQGTAKATKLTAYSITTPVEGEESFRGTVIVQRGDTLWGISQEHGSSVAAIMDLNELSTDLIIEGQTLSIPVVATQTSSSSQEAAPSSVASPHE